MHKFTIEMYSINFTRYVQWGSKTICGGLVLITLDHTVKNLLLRFGTNNSYVEYSKALRGFHK